MIHHPTETEQGLPCILQNCFAYALPESSRCKEHQRPAFFTNNRSESLPKDWKQRREYILQRDRHVCYICGEGGADSVDHVGSRTDHSPHNLKAAHQNVPPYCHRTKTAQEGHEARKQYLAKQWGETFAEQIRTQHDPTFSKPEPEEGQPF